MSLRPLFPIRLPRYGLLIAAAVVSLVATPARATAQACEPFEAPAPVAPYGTVTNARPTFEWKEVPGVFPNYSYTLLVQDGSDQGTVLHTVEGLTGLSWTPPVDLPTDHQLRWKIKVAGPCEVGRFSINAYFYVRTAASPTVTITSPAQGATVPEGTVVRATVSAPVQRVEFYQDGVLKLADTTPPYEYRWDTTVNPLSPLAPEREIHTGYYFAEYKQPETFDATRAEVNGYTDTYIATLSTYIFDYPNEWIPRLEESLDDAVAEGKWIHLGVDLANPDYEEYWDDILEAAGSRWQNILRIEVAHESEASPAQMQAWAQQVRNWISTHNLPLPPQGLGATAVYTQPVPAWKTVPGLDWIGIEAYLVPPGAAVSLDNVEQLLRQLGTARLQVPNDKKIVLIPMAYDRNGAWTDIVKLRDVQTASYVAAQQDARVIGIDPFAYVRLGGTRDHPELKTPHRVMSERILRVPYPGAGNGPHSLLAKAVTTDGKYGATRVGVYVRNRLFFDVALDHGARAEIENVWNAGISEQCAPDTLGRSQFCPEVPIERRHVARWLVKAKEGILYRPPAALGVFTDVAAEDAPWVEDAVNRLIVQPRSPGVFEPLGSITRGETAMSLLRALEGPAYQPPACVTPVFQDVPCTLKIAPWVNELYRRGITTGCSAGFYCPNDVVPRWMMSVFVDRTF